MVKSDTSIVIVAMIALVLGIVMLNASANQIQAITSTYTDTNETVTTAATAGGNVTLTGRNLLNTATVVDSDTGNTINTQNFTVQDGLIDGVQTVFITTLAGAVTSDFNGTDMNVSYQYEPNGYLQNSGARSITNLILVVGGLALVVTAISMLVFGTEFGRRVIRR